MKEAPKQKALTATAAKQYLVEWGGYTAVRKMLTEPEHYYFVAKTYPMGIQTFLRVERGPKEANESWNIEEIHMNNYSENANWSWIDAIQCKEDEEE